MSKEHPTSLCRLVKENWEVEIWEETAGDLQLTNFISDSIVHDSNIGKVGVVWPKIS